MGKTEYQEITRAYLSHLVKSGLVESGAKAILLEDSGVCNHSSHDSIEIVIASEHFGKDLIREGRSLYEATWDIDPRIAPFAAPMAEWQNYKNYFMLARARKEGCIIQL